MEIKLDILITAILMLIGMVVFAVGGFTHSDGVTDAGVVTMLVSLVPILITSILDERGC